METRAVLVPIKAFADAKVRLAPALPPEERAGLARAMGHQVLVAAGALPTAVVCDDPEVAGWAREEGAEVVWAPGLGLNGAVEAGVGQLGRAGITQVIVAHGDLPLATDLSRVAGSPGVTLVPDRHRIGTNVACVPAGAGFRFHYGPGSLALHLVEARRLGLEVRVVEEPSLAWDVDVPDDLSVLRGIR